jgi:aspartate oxidase
MATLRKVARMAFWAESKDTNSGEAVDLAREAAWSRRRFLEATGKGLLLTGAAPMAGGLIKPTLLGTLQKAVAPRIAIVGGGMAGLSALHTLKKAGI